MMGERQETDMKRFLSALLMTLIMVQVLPLRALAATGRVLTDGELAAAYALTGFGADGVSSNAPSYHKGMTPNDTWYAMQVSDWLDVGSGRGVFLFPFMREFPWVPVTCLDLLEKRVALLNALHEGGVELDSVQDRGQDVRRDTDGR